MTLHRKFPSLKVPTALPVCLLALCFWTLNGVQLAHASSITINFTNSTLTTSSSDAAIESYIDSLLPAGASVTVSGASVDVGNSYDADGYIVGPNSTTPLTLGDTTGCAAANSSCYTNYYTSANQTFLQNTTSGSGASDEITLTFTGIDISSISFDYEIFPNGSCLTSSECIPTLEFTDGTLSETFDSYTPGTSGTYKDSASGGSNTTEPQALGLSGTINITSGATTQTMEFIDWPATIGINNLMITYSTPSPVPEPSSLLLLGTGLLGLAQLYRRKRKADRA